MAQFCLFFWLPIVTSIVAFHFVRRLLCNTLQHIRVGGFYFAFPARKYNRKFIDVSAGTDISDGPAGRPAGAEFCSLFYLNLMDFA